MTESIDKDKYKNYLTKATEYLEVAETALQNERYNATVTNCIHCVISAVDSLSVFYFRRRHHGKHEDAIGSMKGTLTSAEYEQISKQYTGLIAIKNAAEYQPDLMKEVQAKDAVKTASRILAKIKEKLPQL